MAFGQSITIGTKTFQNVEPGQYIEQASNIDQPDWLLIDRTVQPDGASSFLIQKKRYKNSSSLVAGTPDELLQVHVVFKLPLKVFTQSEAEAEFAQLVAFLSTANVTKLFRGER